MNKGQSLFEVVIAIAASAFIITALVALVANSIRNASFSKNQGLAANYTQQAMEWLRGQRDSDQGGFFGTYAISERTYCLMSLNWARQRECGPSEKISGTPFFRKVSFSKPSALLQADVVVTWEDAQGTHEVRSTTNFTDWRGR